MVGLRLEQLRQASNETHRNDGYRVVGLRGQQLAVEFPAIGQRAIIAQGALKHQAAIGVLIGWQGLVVDPYGRVLDAATDKSDGQMATVEIGVHDIDAGGAIFALAINHHTKQLALALLLIVIKEL